MRFSIVVPFHNEAGNITALYQRLTSVMESLAVDYELILVDDGSSDGTAAMLERAAASGPPVRAICYQPNRGKGLACCMKDGGGTYKVASAAVKMNSDGSIILLTGTVEIGQGARTALSQIVAEEQLLAE